MPRQNYLNYSNLSYSTFPNKILIRENNEASKSNLTNSESDSILHMYVCETPLNTLRGGW